MRGRDDDDDDDHAHLGHDRGGNHEDGRDHPGDPQRDHDDHPMSGNGVHDCRGRRGGRDGRVHALCRPVNAPPNRVSVRKVP